MHTQTNRNRGHAREPSRFTPRVRELRMPRVEEESSWSPSDRLALKEVTADRDRLREQLDHVRDLSDRLIDTCEAKQAQIFALEVELAEKNELIRDLEEENHHLISHVSNRETRIGELERFLTLIDEAHKRG